MRVGGRGGPGCFSLWSCLVVCFALWLLGPAPPACADSSPRVVVLLSDSSAAYREVADSFVEALAGKYPVQIKALGDLRNGEIATLQSDKTLIVPVGVRAMREMYGVPASTAPILTLLVPRAASRSLSDAGVRDSAVYIDQQPARSLEFTKLLLPKARTVGVIMSDEAASGLRAYANQAARAKLELVTETVRERQDVQLALQRLLPQIDVLLLVPDSAVVNENTVRQILIASYRQRIPVIGFSRGLTNAGAVASLVSSPAGIGRQGGLMARQWNPATGALPGARYADDFEIVVNRQVLRSLEIDVPGEAGMYSVLRGRFE